MGTITGITFYGEMATQFADKCKEQVIQQLIQFGETKLTPELAENYAIIVIKKETLGQKVLRKLGIKKDDDAWYIRLVKVFPDES